VAAALGDPERGVALRKLEEEANKRRRRVTLRQLIARYWDDGLSTVRPVWFGSPETVAALFPLRSGLFDLIIFDEASQCPVECGVPVLVRGQRAVIAGDDKQMPPSHFFQAVDTADAADEEDDGEGDDDEALLASHSLLALARIAFDHTTLRWHYRSRHEALIAFSNHAYYGGRLITAPSVSGSRPGDFSGLNWQSIRGGLWREQTNLEEGRAVVALVQQLLDRAGPDGAPLSVGVVAFNLKQAELIEHLLDEAALADPSGLGRLLEKDRARPPIEQLFVRNLENVQGDERDIIIFSVGYAPTEPGGRIHARFGPLGQAGGENRLNVAVTRARQGIYVLCSFDPDELDVAGTRNPGPKLLKLYLKYVRAVAQDRRQQAARLLDRAAELTGEPGAVAAAVDTADPAGDRRIGARVRRELAEALRRRGEEVAERYGLGALRIDLALPARQLAVDCGAFLTVADPLVRDVYGPRFWRRLGWRMARVTPGMWLEEREQVIGRLLDAINGVSRSG
jgi:superfamily I DNA and/or RNA helicase